MPQIETETVIDTSKMSAGQRAALELSEGARETAQAEQGFVGGLFMGRCQIEKMRPFPAQPVEARDQGDAFLTRLRAFLTEHVDPDEIDRTGEIPDEVIEGLAKLGAFGIKISPEYGGLGLSQTNYCRAGMLGKKSGRGFYVHEKGKEVPNAEAAKLRDAGAGAAPDKAAMQKRMVLLMVNEAARCIEEKVVAEPADADFGMIMGAGFAPFRGGPLRYADAVGVAEIVAGLQTEAERSGPYFAPCELIKEMSKTNRKFYATD